MATFILEGEWSGYTSAQRHIVHREVVSQKRADALRKIYGIRYTDGTMLFLSVRERKSRERVETKNSYGSLIREAEALGKSVFVIGVDDEPVPAAKAEAA